MDNSRPSMSRSSSSSGYLVDMGSVRLDHESKPRTLRDSVRPYVGEDVRRSWLAHFRSPTTLRELRHRAISKGGLSLSPPTSSSTSRPDFLNPSSSSSSDLNSSTNSISKKTKGAAGQDEQGPLMRSVYWRIYLGTLPYPFPPSPLLTTTLLSSRASYDSLRRKYLVAPDGRWAGDCTSPEDGVNGHGGAGSGAGAGGRESLDMPRGEPAWDPLNLGDENPWQTWFQYEELRKTILKDIERTFPDIPYFIDPQVRKVMMTILFLWAVENDDVGYRQGMHELLAVLLMVCDRDAHISTITTTHGFPTPSNPLYSPLQTSQEEQAATESEAVMATVLDPGFVEHDVWALFERVMGRAKGWYEWRSRGGGEPSAAKIVGMCNHLQGVALKQVDPLLYNTLENEGVEGQLWGIRYIRLLFTREMPLLSAMRLWDGLFAEDPELTSLVEGVCLAMLIRIRGLLVQGDYATILTHLLRYPGDTPELPLVPDMLLHQALSLRQSPTPATGANIALQNTEVLGIAPVVLLEDEPVHVRLSSPGVRGRIRVGAPPSPRGPGDGLAPRVGGTRFDTLARGLMERAQASGLDKTVYSAITEIRKNLPEFPTTPTGAFPFRTFSNNNEDPDGYSHIPSPETALPQPPPRTLRDADLEIAELRLSLINMGKAMDKYLDVVKLAKPAPSEEKAREETEVTETTSREGQGEVPAPKADAGDGATKEAWNGLDRLRDSLLNAAVTPASELARQWAWSMGGDPEPRKTEALSQLVNSDPHKAAILGQAHQGHVRKLSDTTAAAAMLAATPPRSPRHVNPALHPPLTNNLAALIQGNSPRQFAFPSPFAGTSTSTTGRPDWTSRKGEGVPIPPPIRQIRTTPTRPVPVEHAVLFEQPDTPSTAGTTVNESYPPKPPPVEEPAADIDPLSGLKATTAPSSAGLHAPRKAFKDPLLG